MMASLPLRPDTKMSFAKVAASGGKENTTINDRPVGPNVIPRKQPGVVTNGMSDAVKPAHPKNGSTIAKATTGNKSILTQLSATQKSVGSDGGRTLTESALIDAVGAISIGQPPNLVISSSDIPDSKVFSNIHHLDESSRTDSDSDLGTKPPSTDGKSITSGTTFALDEKESLRPDDSASVKAAEDDDTFSGRGSIVAHSRTGSEGAGRAYKPQAYDGSDRRAIAPTPERNATGAITPQSGSSGQQVLDGANSKSLIGTTGGPQDGFDLFYRHPPDEKLLEALESPKDRNFLLRLEQDVIDFVKDSKEPFVDLPPCNSFCRMLTHKLADYYHMTHQYDAVTGSVRIFRTPFCRLPQSLTAISNPPTSGNTPPPVMPAMTIMRRGGENGGSPSKGTSEVGSDGKEKSQAAKEKLSREEREAQYMKARERIFGPDKTGDATPETEGSNDMSRSSSVSTKDKAGQNKRGKPGRQRRDDAESFDVRSQYTPFFPPAQQPTWLPGPQYGSQMPAPQIPNPMQGMPIQNGYQGIPQPQYGPPPQHYQPGMMTPNHMVPYNQMPQQYPRPGPQQFQAHSAPLTAYGSPSQTPPQLPSPWQQNNYPSAIPYGQRVPAQGLPSVPVPYPYGQLPNTANPADPKSQHPIPGSFNRHAFNPKTQSFVPGNVGMPPQQNMAPNMPPQQYNSFGPQHQPQFMVPYPGAPAYSMSRQGSNKSLPSYHASPHMGTRPIMQGMAMSHQGLPQMPPQMQQGMPSSNQIGTHLPQFGNPSTLPPKPPPAA